jgi:hypothetical protein
MLFRLFFPSIYVGRKSSSLLFTPPPVRSIFLFVSFLLSLAFKSPNVGREEEGEGKGFAITRRPRDPTRQINPSIASLLI